MHVTFEIKHDGSTFEVEGNSDWRGYVEPVMGPQPTCTVCHGSGEVRDGYNPPDEWNVEGEPLYGPCECVDTFEVHPGEPGEPVLVVESVLCLDPGRECGDSDGYLSEIETDGFMEAVGKQLLAERAHEAACACQG